MVIERVPKEDPEGFRACQALRAWAEEKAFSTIMVMVSGDELTSAEVRPTNAAVLSGLVMSLPWWLGNSDTAHDLESIADDTFPWSQILVLRSRPAWLVFMFRDFTSWGLDLGGQPLVLFTNATAVASQAVQGMQRQQMEQQQMVANFLKQQRGGRG